MTPRAARRYAAALAGYLALALTSPYSLHGFCPTCLREFETRWIYKYGVTPVDNATLEAEGVPEVYRRFLAAV